MATYVEILFRHKIRFLALFLILAALGVSTAAYFISYRATATLSVADPSSFGASSFVPVGWSQNATPAQNVADSAGQVIKTQAFAQKLSTALSTSGTVPSDTEAQQLGNSVGANLKVDVTGAHLLTLNYTCRSSDLCVPVLSVAVSTLRQQLVQVELDQAAATTTFWKAQLDDAQTNLRSAQSDLQRFGAANPGVAVDANATDPQVVQLQTRIKQWQAKVAEAQNNLNFAQYTGDESARLIEMGTAVVIAPRMASGLIGDGASLKPAILALAGGLAIALAYLLLLARVDRTVRDPRSLERLVGVRVVATIPKLVSSRGF